ncbi:MAG: single-stranded DNA-binding protein [Clostridiales bacterium]|nr:single-stranded DNA-binding protein [Clostridiales bacterium]
MNSNVVIIGKVCKGFEARDAGDKKVGRFSVVVNTGKQDAEGKDVGAFYEIESWNDKQHDAYRDFVKVGDLVAVKGNLSIDTYEKSDGGKGTSLKIKNPDVTFLGQAKSPGMATITAVGRLTRDVETKELDGGKKVANFTVAANDGGKEDSANFLNVELWNDRTKAAEFLQKGSLISVSGKLNIDTYEKSDGGKGISAKISNPEIVFLDKKREDGGKAPAEFDKIKAPAANKSAGNSK